ncbi:uncharacterized protein LOC123499514 isoform X2 [Portunus trituberculatus]|uniref:Uncharacterized protein n=2 Tax=Portunus trituberculatus TaxID=210409 RepID=A0A5B7IZD6_PORTR|nr:uncharacterized protein LOC123499514 isoform X2 [Portunus trituberculatus]MPC89890.1 hypothetical protein [Portunus trituberculatus]
MRSALRLLCAVLLVLVVSADLATFIYGYHYDILEDDDPWLGAQLLCGGGLLLSVLLIPILAYFFSMSTRSLSQCWFAVHITWGDNWARHTVVLLYTLQVQPVLDILELNDIVADLKTADYWWWFVQGLLLVVLLRALVGCDAEDDLYEEQSNEMPNVASHSRPPLEIEGSQALVTPTVTYPVTPPALPATQDSTTIEEISSTIGDITP